MKKVAISQSNYIPWKGYFDAIHTVDEFILYDDMQYTKRDWRNRNRIKTAHGLEWLSIPVQVKGRFTQKINETLVSDPSWGRSHWSSIRLSYARAPYFDRYRERFERLYSELEDRNLSVINRKFIDAVCEALGITTRIGSSSDYTLVDGKTERLVDLCRQVGATDYYSGPTAREYIDPERFREAGIELHFFDNTGYREYPQLWGKFEHAVTVLDLIFNTGPDAPNYMKSWS